MESAEGIVATIKRRFNFRKTRPQLTPEAPRPIPGWNYETYREYLLALSRGREFLLLIEEYPSKMDLNESWHGVFNQTRAGSNEGWVLVGYEFGQRRLVLPRVAEQGLSHCVPHEVMSTGLEKARAKAGITDLIGDAHSHPRPYTDLSWHIPSEVTSEGESAFSLGDLYGLLYDLNQQRPSDPKRSIMFVVEGNENIAAFATRRSLELVRNNFSGPYERFACQWYERYGWRFKGLKPLSEGGGELADQTRANAAKLWQINKGIAFHYQLALYRGFKDKPLLRDHPARNNI